MKTCREIVQDLWAESDPIDYLLTHSEEMRWAMRNERTLEERWEELKRRLVEYKKFERDDYSRGWNHAVNYGLKIMEELEEK